MHRALLLHGTNGDAQSNWLPWLKNELESAKWNVWVPDLPGSDEPNIRRYNEYILKNHSWKFDAQTTIVGHSSGAVAALGLLQVLPETVKIKQAILVGSFKDDLGWPSLTGLFERPLDFEQIKNHAGKFLLIHSDDDPYCPLEHARYLADKLDGELKIITGQKHFSAETDPSYTRFELLRDLLIARS